MITVIIAGGSGTRLWPLSTPGFPKHLLRLSGKHSLIQNTYQRAKRLSNDVYVITEASHAHHVRDQLSELDTIPEQAIIVEPGRRGTASCVVMALAHIAKYHDPSESIVFMHADHYIRDVESFVDTVEYAGKVATEKQSMVLLGVEPDHPATGFGYIQKGDQLDADGMSFVYAVDSFKEKPDYQTAQKYTRSGRYLWNMGYFVAPLSVFLDTMFKHAPVLFANYQAISELEDEATLTNAYLEFENEPIDTALIEKSPGLLVVPGAFDWADIGSFADLHKVVDIDAQQNHVAGEGIELDSVENAYVRNDESKPLAIIGLDNVVVINTPDGILVARKDLSQKVGDIAKKIQKKNQA